MTGDAEGQPVEGVEALDDLAAGMDETDAGTEGDDLPEVEDEDSEAEVPDSEEESEDEDDAEEDEQEEPTVTLKHDGKEVTLKQSEVVELAQQGFDYTKKTMAVAEERKAVDAEKAKLAEIRQHNEQALDETVQRLTAYRQFMESQVGSPPPISLAQQDAAQYLAQKELYESRKGQLQQANAEISRLQEEQHRQRQAALLQEAESTERTLRDTLPGWNDKSLAELSDYMASVGLKPELNEAFVSKGLWEMAHKARAYDALQAEKAKLKPVAKLAKVQKPSAANHPPKRGEAQRKDAEKRYYANPSLNSLAALVE